MLVKSLHKRHYHPGTARRHAPVATAPRRDPFELAGKVAIVTGAASGIGHAVAELLLSFGAHVIAVDRDTAGLRRLRRQRSHRAGQVVTVDGVLGAGEVERASLGAALTGFGRLDAAMFAAGAGSIGDVTDLTSRALHDSVATNVDVHLPLSQQILQHFMQRSSPDRTCSLVYVISKVAIAPTLGFGGYPIAKAAALQLARMVALQGARHGVRANCVNPGAVFEGSAFWNRDMVVQKATSHGVAPEDLEAYYAQRTMLNVRVTPKDVAYAMAFLASPLSRATTGAAIPVDGGLAETFSR